MGCSSCSTGKDGGGGCGTSGTSSCGCNKLSVYNWLANMQLPPGQAAFNIVEVRFKGSRKEFFKNAENLPIQSGDVVAVEGNPGHDIGVVSLVGELVRFQLKKKGLTETSEEVKALYRKARQADIEKWQASKDLEPSTMLRARGISQQLKLLMKLSDVEYQGDGKKATFYYTAEDRVDFRELIKRLADEFKVRIEMRQIGMRQEASRLGGIGSCGRELCCSTWLTDFRSVSTGAARYQNLSLNPLKLAGQCGKLKCCLNYELDSYMDTLKDFPDTNVPLKTQRGMAFHKKTDIFKRTMWYSYDNSRVNDESMDIQAGGGSWIAMPVERVNEIVGLNKKNILPEDLSKKESFSVLEPKKLDYENVVGQDSITRMDKKKQPRDAGRDNRGGGRDNRRRDQPREKAKGPNPQQAEGKREEPRLENRGQEQKPQQQRPQENRPKQPRIENKPPQAQTPRPEAPQRPTPPAIQPNPDSANNNDVSKRFVRKRPDGTSNS